MIQPTKPYQLVSGDSTGANITCTELYSTISNLQSSAGSIYPIVFISDNTKEGIFEYDAADTTTADDAYNTIVTTTGKRYKRIVKISTIDTIATLRTVRGGALSTVVVSGYYTINDGGGGQFYWNPTSTATDNNGTIIAVSGVSTGRWIRIVQSDINIRWFGAKGDDTNDDTVPINDTILYAYSVKSHVTIPVGVYKTTGTINLKSGVSVKGADGRPIPASTASTIINYNGTGVAIQAYSNNTPYLNSFDGVSLSGFYLKDVLATGTIGLDLQGFRWSKVECVAVNGFGQGLHTFQNWFSSYEDLFFSTYRDKAIYVEGLDNNTTFRKIKIGAAGAGAVTPHALFYGATTITVDVLDSESNVGGVKFDNCISLILNNFYFETSASTLQSYALLLSSCVASTINGAYIDGNNLINNGIYNSSTHTKINGGKIIDCVKPVEDTSFGKEISIEGLYSVPDVVYGGSRFGNKKIGWTRWTAAPTTPTGAWNKGDFVTNDNPATGSPIGWVCTVAGTPGTWKEFGIIEKRKSGTSTQSGTGILTSFTIAHSLGATPTFLSVQAGSANAVGIAYVTADATNITVYYDIAPLTGTNNLTFYWEATV